MRNINALRHDIAVYAEKIWDTEEVPHYPFGFAFLDWSIEVHVRLDVEEGTTNIPTVKLDVYKVTHTGQLEELAQVRI